MIEELINTEVIVMVLDDVSGEVSSMVIVSFGPNMLVLMTSKSMLMVSSIRFSVVVIICSIAFT